MKRDAFNSNTNTNAPLNQNNIQEQCQSMCKTTINATTEVEQSFSFNNKMLKVIKYFDIL